MYRVLALLTYPRTYFAAAFTRTSPDGFGNGEAILDLATLAVATDHNM